MRVLDVLLAPWAIIPENLEELTAIYSTHLRGEKIDIKALEAKIGEPLANGEQGYEVRDGVAIIPMEGVIAKRMNLFMHISGGVSTQLLERDFRQAMADPNVHSIILNGDTPGGSVDGIAEVAKVIYDARGEKPIVTLADGMLASAGVWIGSAADRIYMTGPTTAVGSIGVVAQHVDRSEFDKKIGIKVTEIYAGKYKRIASNHEPLTEDGREDIQAAVDYLYSIFVDVVALHRGTSTEDVLARMADGRLFTGQQAIDAGLVDGVSTLEELVVMLNDEDTRGNFSAGAVEVTNGAEAVDASEIETSEDNPMNLDELREQHSDLYSEAVAVGHAEGKSEGLVEGENTGAANERARIQGVFDAALPGHEALIQTLAFDGKTSPGEAATAVLQAERAQRDGAAAARAADAEDLDGVTVSVEAEPEAASEGSTPDEEWESNASLRAEFGDSKERYLAWAENQSKVRVLGGKG